MEQFKSLAAAQEFCAILKCSGYRFSILEISEGWAVKYWPDEE